MLDDRGQGFAQRFECVVEVATHVADLVVRQAIELAADAAAGDYSEQLLRPSNRGEHRPDHDGGATGEKRRETEPEDDRQGPFASTVRVGFGIDLLRSRRAGVTDQAVQHRVERRLGLTEGVQQVAQSTTPSGEAGPRLPSG
ncbi:MAG: hypothetical protein R2705_07655 [Ilumatobacteraceae bacterium]